MRKQLTPEQREKKKIANREWQKNNRDKANGYDRKWRKNNPEKAKESQRKYQGKIKNKTDVEADNQVKIFEVENTTEETIKFKGDSTMNTELQIFKNEEFGEVRTIEENGQVYFCGSDVAKALGYAIPNKAILDHCRSILKWNTPHPQSPSKTIEMNFIPEGDLYRLIVNSKLESAEKFEKWVFDEVLPTIRKTGSYHQPMATEDIMIYQLTELKKIKQQQLEQQLQLDTVSTRLDGMKDVISLNTTSWRDDCRKIIVRIAEKMGGHSYIQLVNADIYKNCLIPVRVAVYR